MTARDRLIEVLTDRFQVRVGADDDPGGWRISRSAAREMAAEAADALAAEGLVAVALAADNEGTDR